MRDVKSAGEFAGRYAVLAVGDEPEGGEPSREFERAVFQHRPDLDAELLLTAFALPHKPRLNEADVSRPAARAGHAVFPSAGNHVIMANLRTGKQDDGFLQRLGKFEFTCHTLIIPARAEKVNESSI